MSTIGQREAEMKSETLAERRARLAQERQIERRADMVKGILFVAGGIALVLAALFGVVYLVTLAVRLAWGS
jgi:fatty acid desaturase